MTANSNSNNNNNKNNKNKNNKNMNNKNNNSSMLELCENYICWRATGIYGHLLLHNTAKG